MVVGMIPSLEEEDFAESLGEALGVTGDYLQKLKSGRYNTVDFDFADRLVCHFSGPDFWHQPDIEPFYNMISLFDPTPGLCMSHGCGREIPTTPASNGAVPRFCSKHCRDREYRRREKAAA
jgi:hypothetical protein